MSDLCAVCRGAGNLVTFTHGMQFWDCLYCGGSGVRVQYGPAMLSRKRKQ